MSNKDCRNECCVARRLMLKEDLTGIVKCSNPNCNMYFDFIDYEDSIEKELSKNNSD